MLIVQHSADLKLVAVCVALWCYAHLLFLQVYSGGRKNELQV